jgi:hypothetical protein
LFDVLCRSQYQDTTLHDMTQAASNVTLPRTHPVAAMHGTSVPPGQHERFAHSVVRIAVVHHANIECMHTLLDSLLE